MHDQMFFTTVAVSAGLGLRREIASLSEMHEFLTEWEPSRRSISYDAAVAAVEAARAGDISVAAARDAFITFANTAGILWPEAQPIISVKPVARSFGGFAS